MQRPRCHQRGGRCSQNCPGILSPFLPQYGAKEENVPSHDAGEGAEQVGKANAK